MNRFRSLTAGVAVAGLLATGIAFAQGPHGGPGGRGRGVGFGPGALGVPLRQLNLTDTQRTQLEQIRDQHRADLQNAMQKLAAARQAQHDLSPPAVRLAQSAPAPGPARAGPNCR